MRADGASAVLQALEQVIRQADTGQVGRVRGHDKLPAPLLKRPAATRSPPALVGRVEPQEQSQAVVVVSGEVVGQQSVQLGAEGRQRTGTAEGDGRRRGRPARRRQRPAGRPARAHRLPDAGFRVIITADTHRAAQRAPQGADTAPQGRYLAGMCQRN